MRLELVYYSENLTTNDASSLTLFFVRLLQKPQILPQGYVEITAGRGVDAVVDTVSSPSTTAGLDMLAFGGGIACIAGLPDFRK